MQAQRGYSKLIAVLAHILVWAVLGLAIFYYQPFFSGIDIPYQFWIRQTVVLGLLVIAFYVNAFVLVPRFLLKNHTGYYFVIIIGIVAAIVFINGWVDRALNLHQLFEEAFHKRGAQQALRHRPPKGQRNGGMIDTLTLTISALVIGISTSMTTIQKWQKDKQAREELEKDKVTSELSFLKAQINPHFFFNTLNNIYALTLVDGEIAGKAIHQLSRMMRYLLYDTQSGQTMLSQEIAFVKDYISLMKLRLTDAVQVNIDTPSDLKDLPLAPMIFLPFVENAFKHGVSATQKSHIDIVVRQKENVLDLTVKNSIMKDNSVSLDTNSGIGLVNTRRRLDLLYPGKYKLDITEQNAANEYVVHLILDLS
ncbi:MAG: histidine kinase [Bacteroidetes bacterium]|nr:histidine kinase [Bacteroidota bacterium]